MVRKPPGVVPPVFKSQKVLAEYSAREHELTFSTITPMFGGSPWPLKVNPAAPVAARSVRGHLRFWWRALNGSRFASLSELFKVESRIWGSASSSHGNPSKVDISVELLRSTTLLSCDQLRDLKEREEVFYCGYGLFDSKTPIEGLDRFPFKVTATCDAELWENDVAPTVRAWSLLGGVGRRTRRGFGSLRQYHESRGLFGFPKKTKTHKYSLLPTTWLVGPKSSSAKEAWFWILDKFKAPERYGPKPRGRMASPVVVKAVADPRDSKIFWPVAFQFKAPKDPNRHRIDHVWNGLSETEGLCCLSIGEFPHE